MKNILQHFTYKVVFFSDKTMDSIKDQIEEKIGIEDNLLSSLESGIKREKTQR